MPLPEFSSRCTVCIRENKFCKHLDRTPTIWKCLICSAGSIRRSSTRAKHKASAHTANTGHDVEIYMSPFSLKELREKYSDERDMNKIKRELALFLKNDR